LNREDTQIWVGGWDLIDLALQARTSEKHQRIISDPPFIVIWQWLD
jgi:hypothetical protein